MKRRLAPLSTRGAYNHCNGPYQNIWCLQYFPLIQRRQRNRHIYILANKYIFCILSRLGLFMPSISSLLLMLISMLVFWHIQYLISLQNDLTTSHSKNIWGMVSISSWHHTHIALSVIFHLNKCSFAVNIKCTSLYWKYNKSVCLVVLYKFTYFGISLYFRWHDLPNLLVLYILVFIVLNSLFPAIWDRIYYAVICYIIYIYCVCIYKIIVSSHITNFIKELRNSNYVFFKEFIIINRSVIDILISEFPKIIVSAFLYVL